MQQLIFTFSSFKLSDDAAPENVDEFTAFRKKYYDEWFNHLSHVNYEQIGLENLEALMREQINQVPEDTLIPISVIISNIQDAATDNIDNGLSTFYDHCVEITATYLLEYLHQLGGLEVTYKSTQDIIDEFDLEEELADLMDYINTNGYDFALLPNNPGLEEAGFDPYTETAMALIKATHHAQQLLTTHEIIPLWDSTHSDLLNYTIYID